MKTIIQRLFTMLLVIVLISSIIPFSAMAAAPAMPNTYISRVEITATNGVNGALLYSDIKTYNSSSGLIAYNERNIDFVIPASVWKTYNTAYYTAKISVYHATANECSYWLGGGLRDWMDITPGITQVHNLPMTNSRLDTFEGSFQGSYLNRDRSTFQASEKKYVNINFIKEDLRPAPTGVGYENISHRITGLDSNMVFRHNTLGTWSDWYYINVQNGSYNLYPNLLSSSSTQIEVMYSSPASEKWTFHP